MALIWILWGSSAPLYWHVMRRTLCELNIFLCFVLFCFFEDIFLTGTHPSILFMYADRGRVRPCL